MALFETALRGYDMRQVDRLVDRIEGTLGRRSLLDEPVTVAELADVGFDVKLRGYDRLEVDQALAAYRRELEATSRP